MKEAYALVTGASGEIGSAIARKLAADGYALYLHYNRNEAAVDRLLADLRHVGDFGKQHVKVQADFSSENGVYRLLEQLDHPVEVIVHNSGASYVGLITDMNDAEVRDLIQLHVTSPFLLTKYLLGGMVSRRCGKIIVISSIWGRVGASTEVLYSTVKGALNSFVKSLAKETAPSGISVNGVAPGAVATKMLDHLTAVEKASLREEIPMGRFAKAEEIASLVSFLISKQASYINGEIVGIDGAWH
jgi:3-oxoacyl-[acyl-carrier protein] reductase